MITSPASPVTVFPFVSATAELLSRLSEPVPVTGVVTVLVHRAAAGQVESPPPLAVAVFTTFPPLTLAVGVTGIWKLAVPFAARPAAIVHVTTCPAAVQPAGSVPMVRPVGMVSLMVATAVVAAVPVFCTLSV